MCVWVVLKLLQLVDVIPINVQGDLVTFGIITHKPMVQYSELHLDGVFALLPHNSHFERRFLWPCGAYHAVFGFSHAVSSLPAFDFSHNL